MNKYLDHDYSKVFSNAEIHWHLWNEVIEIVKHYDPSKILDRACCISIDTIKRAIYNLMTNYKVIDVDSPTQVLSLSNTLCVLCSVNPACVVCPLRNCHGFDSYYYRAERALNMANTCCTEEMDDEMFDGYIKLCVKNATDIRDILEVTMYDV